MSEVRVSPHFPVLDSLRAVGALAVLTTHVGFYAGSYGQGTWGAFLARLDVGVAIFFVLSGFLLSRPYLARAASALPRPATSRYLWKRFLRIFPVYVVAVVLGLSLLEDNADLGLRDWVVTLVLGNTFLDPLPPAGLSQMWSLGVEVSFYLILPAVMLAATGRRSRGLRPLRVMVVVLAMAAVSVWWHLDGAPRSEQLSDGPALQWLPAYLGWFAVGIGLALAHVVLEAGGSSRIAARVLALGREPGVCWTIVASLMLVASTPLAGPVLLTAPTPSASLTKNLLYAVIGGLIILTGISARPESRYARVMGSPIARHLGMTSYGVFCLHLLLLDLIAPAIGIDLFEGHFTVLLVVTVAASVAAAEVTYRLVERPAMRWAHPGSARDGRAPKASATSGTNDR